MDITDKCVYFLISSFISFYISLSFFSILTFSFCHPLHLFLSVNDANILPLPVLQKNNHSFNVQGLLLQMTWFLSMFKIVQSEIAIK
jgi:hypothetical protein